MMFLSTDTNNYCDIINKSCSHWQSGAIAMAEASINNVKKFLKNRLSECY